MPFPPSRSTTRWAPRGIHCSSNPEPTAPLRSRLIFQVGYYTEVAGLGLSPTDVTINGQYRRLQPVHHSGLLLRAEQFLAVHFQPDHQRHQRRGDDRLPQDRQLLGRLAGLADAPGQRQRQPDLDGLLHQRAAVGQRRIHGRLQGRQCRQRVAAAVPGAQQHHRHLDERRLEPGVRGCSRRARRRTSRNRCPMAPRGPTPPCRRTRRAGRSLTSTSTRRAVQRLGAERRDQQRRHHLGIGPDARRSIPLSSFYLATPVELGGDHQQPAEPGQEPDPDPRCLRRGADDRREPRGHRRSRPGHGHPDRGERRGPADRRQRQGRRSSPASPSTPARSTRRR